MTTSPARHFAGLRTRYMPPEIPEDLEAFREVMARWDWYYAMSDDHGIWQAGERASAALNAFLASPRCTPEHHAIYKAALPK